MALKVRWTEIALNDLNSTFEFISVENPEAAGRVISQILDALEQLKLFPDSGRQGRVPTTRELVIAGTPYIIVYRQKDQFLELIAILHSARKWPR